MWMPRRCSAIALDVGRASVTACQVVRDRRAIVLRNWIAIEDPLRERPGEDTLGDAPAARTARLVRQSGFKGRHVILALKPPDVNFITVRLPEAVLSSSREQILSGLRFEAARELQCDPKSLVVDGWPLPAGSRSGENFMIAAVVRDAVEDWSRFTDTAGLIVRQIEVLPSALLRAACHNQDGTAASLWGVLDIGYGSCVLALARGCDCVYVRQLSVDGDALTRSISDALGVDYGTAEILKREYHSPRERGAAQASSQHHAGGDTPQAMHALMRSQVKSLTQELERAFGYVMENYPDLSPTVLYLSGGGAKLRDLDVSLSAELGIRVEALDPCVGLSMGHGAARVAESSRMCMAASVGMAIGDVA